LITVAPGISNQGGPDPQRLGHHLAVVAAVGEIETEQQIERFAIQGADREHVGRQFEHQLVLLHGAFDLIGIDVAGTNPPRLDGTPAVVALVFVFLQHEITPVAAIEVPHGGIALLHAFEEVEDCLPIGRKFHFRAQIHVDVEVVAQRTVLIHPGISLH